MLRSAGSADCAAKPEKQTAPSLDLWLHEAKASPEGAECGMYLFHNGVVRATAKRTARLGEDAPPVRGMVFDYDEVKTAAAIDADGWLHTGDIGRIDEAGNVWITGRASRTIILSSGKKIAPEELEEKLHAIPGVLEAVVSGDGESREIRAEVYASIPEDAVRRAVGELNLRLPVYKRIGTVTTRNEPFPRTSSGKIKYS